MFTTFALLFGAAALFSAVAIVVEKRRFEKFYNGGRCPTCGNPWQESAMAGGVYTLRCCDHVYTIGTPRVF